MTNETIELMYQHGSVRHYKSDPLPDGAAEQIVAAGQRASTSSNLQMYSVVALADAKRRAEMSVLCGNQAFIREAPLFLAWCADLSRLERVANRRGYSQVSAYAENFLLSVVDVSLAMQNAALAAESMGLGICYVGAIRNQSQDVIDMLELPRLVFPIAGMSVGYPGRSPRIRPRLPLEAILHWDVYSTEDEEAQIAAYDEAMIATGIYRGRQVDSEGTNKVEPYGWSEHSARRVAKIIRPGLKQVLERQGFAVE